MEQKIVFTRIELTAYFDPQLLHYLQNIQLCQGDGPLLIHCSGGVGRSGTFTTIYTFLNMLKTANENQDDSVFRELLGSNDELILHPLVCHLRDSRHPWMVEGEHQYLLAYETCIQLLKEYLEK